MYIQYVGFNVAGSSRVYNYDVLDIKERREFTVKVQSEAFRPARLELQDGPSICFDRVKRELGAETEESRAEANLSIGERDIDEYLERQYPRKSLAKKAASGR
ncbi:MAG: hypothetical protein DMG25_15690 [Acidobacteria bacterium]|nr:MAG: hypothetical protein DMG25_15690 [Acidobacteriota bacterium]